VRLALALALLVVAGFAPAPLPRARRAEAEDDLRKMQGTWVVVKYEHDGGDHLASYREEIRFTFRGGRMTCSLNDDVRSTWDVELSPASVPRAITKTKVGGAAFVMRGIYRFEGERLVICQDNGDGKRPAEFDSRGNRWLIVMRRR
jgi:uncharacterized protein (TIGR03067 family)